MATYTDVDLAIINAAAKSVGAGRVTKLTDNRSTEAEHVHSSSDEMARSFEELRYRLGLDEGVGYEDRGSGDQYSWSDV